MGMFSIRSKNDFRYEEKLKTIGMDLNQTSDSITPLKPILTVKVLDYDG